MSDTSSDTERHIGGAMCCLAIGACLLYAAFSTWSHGKWPWYMPPQLDVIGVVTSFIPDPLGTGLATAILVILGVLCALCGLLLAVVPDRKLVYPSQADLELHRIRRGDVVQPRSGPDGAQTGA